MSLTVLVRMSSVTGVTLLAPLPSYNYQSSAISPLTYQQRACVKAASGDRDNRSFRSQVDRRKVFPHVCTPAHNSVTALFPSTASTASTRMSAPPHTPLSQPCPIHHFRRSSQHASRVHAQHRVQPCDCLKSDSLEFRFLSRTRLSYRVSRSRERASRRTRASQLHCRPST